LAEVLPRCRAEYNPYSGVRKVSPNETTIVNPTETCNPYGIETMLDAVKEALLRSEASILSPLRYPGAKRRLSGFIAEAIRLNGLRPGLFVEPFAGGASVALQLLNDDLVDRVALGERDPLVASFWKVVFYDSDWLIDQLERVPLTLDQWDKLKKRPGRTDRQRALSCLFLNRTSFSGIMATGAGPIGGRLQKSDYRIDCRYNVETLTKRIQQAAQLAHKVALVESTSWEQTLARVAAFKLPAQHVMYYFDPPFYHRAERLYSHYFTPQDHQALHDTIMSLRSPWLLSYDAAAPIIAMYADNGRRPRHVELLYSLRASSSPTHARELIVSNLKRLPTKTRLWRSNQEWNSSGRNGRRAKNVQQRKARSKP
jgi:DNA adenine methylase